MATTEKTGKKKPQTAQPPKAAPKTGTLLSHARESLKLFETIERQAMGKARKFMRVSLVPYSARRAKLTNDKIIASLKKIGVATLEDLASLKGRIERIEAALKIKAPASTEKTSTLSEHASAVPRA